MSKVNSNDDESDESDELELDSSGGVVGDEPVSALIKLLRRTRDGDEGCSDANMVD